MQRRSLNSAKIRLFKLDYEYIMRMLKEYAEKARARGAKAIILIGSLARGNYTAFSDADVVIIVENISDDYMERIEKFMDPSFPIDLEPRVYTASEILYMAREKRRIIREIVEDGILITGDLSLIEEIRKIFYS